VAAENEIGTAIIGAAIEVHSLVGPGLLESAYEACLVYELEKHGLSVQRQGALPLRYKDLALDIAYRN
jgi:GxxExxY protein